MKESGRGGLQQRSTPSEVMAGSPGLHDEGHSAAADGK